VITTTKHDKNKKAKWTNQKLNQAQESGCEQVTIIGFVLSSDWLRKWCKLSWPIREHSKAKPKQTQFTLLLMKAAIKIILVMEALCSLWTEGAFNLPMNSQLKVNQRCNHSKNIHNVVGSSLAQYLSVSACLCVSYLK